MKLSILTVKSVMKEVEVSPETTIEQLREQIRLLYNWPEHSKIILVHKTKILSQLSTKVYDIANIKEGDRIVVMRKTDSPNPPPLQEQSSAQPQSATNNVDVPTAVHPQPASVPQPASLPASVPIFYNDDQIQQLGGMGFDAVLARQALTAAFGNTDRAVEYLVSGNVPTIVDSMAGDPAVVQTRIPQGSEIAGASSLSNNTDGLQTEAFGPAGGQTAAGEGEQGMPPNALMSQFSQLAASDPTFLPQMLRELGEQNPALLNLIEQNPRMFSQLLTSIAAGDQAADGGPDEQIPQTVTVQLTPLEVEAINRLCELGFSKEAALQAYLACDKNEDLAANFLFDNDDRNPTDWS